MLFYPKKEAATSTVQAAQPQHHAHIDTEFEIASLELRHGKQYPAGLLDMMESMADALEKYRMAEEEQAREENTRRNCIMSEQHMEDKRKKESLEKAIRQADFHRTFGFWPHQAKESTA